MTDINITLAARDDLKSVRARARQQQRARERSHEVAGVSCYVVYTWRDDLQRWTLHSFAKVKGKLTLRRVERLRRRAKLAPTASVVFAELFTAARSGPPSSAPIAHTHINWSC